MYRVRNKLELINHDEADIGENRWDLDFCRKNMLNVIFKVCKLRILIVKAKEKHFHEKLSHKNSKIEKKKCSFSIKISQSFSISTFSKNPLLINYGNQNAISILDSGYEKNWFMITSTRDTKDLRLSLLQRCVERKKFFLPKESDVRSLIVSNYHIREFTSTERR